MNRLSVEFDRLFAVSTGPDNGPVGRTWWVDEQGDVRALVMGLAAPADWRALGAVWHGVQADFGWPAPAIAVSGDDALQLWFSLARAVPAARAHALLQALRQRYLGEVAASRVRLWPTEEGAADAPDRVALQVGDERWSAFVAPDLAPVFADTPWLDLPPGEEGQCGLLAGLRSVSAAEWAQAAHALQPLFAMLPAGEATVEPAMPDPADSPTTKGGAGDGLTEARHAAVRFLRHVMDDEDAPLPQRIEAARVLLSHATR